MNDVVPRPTAVHYIPGLLGRGGAERVAIEIALALVDAGWRSVVAADDVETLAVLESFAGSKLGSLELLRLRDMPRWADRTPSAIAEIARKHAWRRQILALAPDLFVNSRFADEMPGLGFRSVLMCHFPHPREVSYSPRWRGLYMHLIARLASRSLYAGEEFLATYEEIWTNSEYSASHVLEMWNKRASVLYPFCSDMSPPATTQTAQRKRQIVSVGRFSARSSAGSANKRQDALIEGFRELRELHEQGWKLVLAGTATNESIHYVQELQRQAGDLPVDFRVNLSFGDLLSLYQESSLYWHAQGYGQSASADPASQEHFGITTVEAMSAGVIPVVFDTAGPAEVVQPVAGCGRWRTLDELRSETRRLASLSGAELIHLRNQVRARAEDFCGMHSFRRRLFALLDHQTTGSSGPWHHDLGPV